MSGVSQKHFKEIVVKFQKKGRLERDSSAYSIIMLRGGGGYRISIINVIAKSFDEIQIECLSYHEHLSENKEVNLRLQTLQDPGRIGHFSSAFPHTEITRSSGTCERESMCLDSCPVVNNRKADSVYEETSIHLKILLTL